MAVAAALRRTVSGHCHSHRLKLTQAKNRKKERRKKKRGGGGGGGRWGGGGGNKTPLSPQTTTNNNPKQTPKPNKQVIVEALHLDLQDFKQSKSEVSLRY